jgi:GAF domain-containing protein
MAPADDGPELALVLLKMGGLLLSDLTVDTVLELATELTERTVRSASAVSVTLVRDDGAQTPNASEPVARDLDAVQYKADEGPCLEAYAERVVINQSFKEEGSRRWPAFRDAAKAHGIESILSVPLLAGNRAFGALNVYSREPAAFDRTEVATASLLAAQAAAVLANAVAFADASAVNDQLREALESRDLIGQAKGILMERETCDAEAAFVILRRASQRTNRKLREVAAELVAAVVERSVR